ncbi:glycosyl transferase, group 1 family protein [Synechococcus sp. PCC 7335]|uniref:glycosyltransferase n=1 Tax=Synechococcus sp. (strain ATCC 29403 / PCC 7335) TaxID=91464 RepID=UPI00017EE098|nr:glycosyltransferase [Synechococcus sp. PCC 7335]EDX86490.1 glycosyl transferase, group 1 family protein [Synechococcus sp. PCC 7335]
MLFDPASNPSDLDGSNGFVVNGSNAVDYSGRSVSGAEDINGDGIIEMPKRTILIYRDQLLPYSETFIPAQAENYTRYQSFYAGSSRLSNIDTMLPVERCITLEQEKGLKKFWKGAYWFFNFPRPSWVEHLKDIEPCLIHAHFGLDGVMAMPLAKRLRVPLFVTFHAHYATKQPDADFNPREPLYKQLYFSDPIQYTWHLYLRKRAQLFESSNCIIAISNYIRQRLIEQGCPEEKVNVHYIGVDLQQFNAEITREIKASNTQLVNHQTTILFVGRLVEKKGCEYLLRSMAHVQQLMPYVKLIVIGDGVLRQPLENMASKTLRHCQFLGLQSTEMVKKWMALSSVLVVPSVTTETGETEGLPMVILEAMAMGLPVVASFHAGIPEAISHGENGFLVPERSISDLSQAILDLLRYPNIKEHFANKGIETIQANYDLQTNTKHLEMLYDTAVNQYQSSYK